MCGQPNLCVVDRFRVGMVDLGRVVDLCIWQPNQLLNINLSKEQKYSMCICACDTMCVAMGLLDGSLECCTSSPWKAPMSVVV